MKYHDFFNEAYEKSGDPTFGPYDYQRCLAEEAWPNLLDVPTGMGKTAAVMLAWLWKRGWRKDARSSEPDLDTPRRLVYCLPMRVLVEQTHENAVSWLDRLEILAGAAEWENANAARRLKSYAPAPEKSGVSVHLLMGGSEDARTATWAEHPEKDMILIGTQDMLLSAALNRAYATYPSMWPVHFGLLNVDAFWVMDETQLMGPGRTTSVQVQHFFETEGHQVGRDEIDLKRHTLWMSATLGGTTSEKKEKPRGSTQARQGDTRAEPPAWLLTPEIEEVLQSDKKCAYHTYRPHVKELDPVRLGAPKSLECKTGSEGWTFNSEGLLDAIVREASITEDRLILVFVNTVARARALHATLRERCRSNTHIRAEDVILIHSRFRKRDRGQIVKQLLDSSNRSRIVISTQVLEAGVDLDADVLFTEVAPWSSLIQRLGRLNRNGEKPSEDEVRKKHKEPARVYVFDVPPTDDSPGAARGGKRRRGKTTQNTSTQENRDYKPYDAASIEEACEKLQIIEQQHNNDLSPRTLRDIPASFEVEGPVLRRFHLREDLFVTDADLSGGHTDVAPYLRASDRDVDCYVLWRDLSSNSDHEALPADEQPPIHRDELCAAPFYEVAEAFKDKPVWILAYSAEGRRRAAVWRKAFPSQIKPGDTIMVPLEYGGYHNERGWLGTEGAQSQPQSWVTRGEDDSGAPARIWQGAKGRIEVIDHHVDPESGLEGEPRSSWKRRSRDWMTLSDHLEKAKTKAADLVQTIGLRSPISDCIVEADLWHDLGKALERETERDNAPIWARPFQLMLRRDGQPANNHPADGVLYAKSKPKSKSVSESKAGGPDIGRFRHEVASALAYLKQAKDPHALRASLVAFLILAHHGKVRVMPSPWDDERSNDWNGVKPGDRIAEVVLSGNTKLWFDTAVLDLGLFLPAPDHPGWQGRVASLLDHYGPFYLAYMEALVRVADWRAS